MGHCGQLWCVCRPERCAARCAQLTDERCKKVANASSGITTPSVLAGGKPAQGVEDPSEASAGSAADLVEGESGRLAESSMIRATDPSGIARALGFSREALFEHVERRRQQRSVAQVVLILGWRHDIVDLMRAFDARLAEGSTVYVLSQQPMARRQEEFSKMGLALDGGKLEDGGSDGPFDGAAEDEVGWGGRMDPQGALRNTRVRHLLGSPSSLHDLRKLPIGRASSAIIFTDAEADADGESSQLQVAEVVSKQSAVSSQQSTVSSQQRTASSEQRAVSSEQ